MILGWWTEQYGQSEVKSLSRVQLFATPWAVVYQALSSMGFSRQEYWNGLPFPSPGDLPNPGVERILVWRFTLWTTREVLWSKVLPKLLFYLHVYRIHTGKGLSVFPTIPSVINFRDKYIFQTCSWKQWCKDTPVCQHKKNYSPRDILHKGSTLLLKRGTWDLIFPLTYYLFMKHLKT